MHRHTLGELDVRYRGPQAMPESTLVVIERLSGRLSSAELHQMTRNLVERWDPMLRVHLLVDVRDADLDGISFDDLVAYVRHTERLGLHHFAPRIAIVAGTDKNRSLARLYQSLVRREGQSLAVFSEMEQALGWIRSPSSAQDEDKTPRGPATPSK
jgi:hypothetical protein